MINVEVSLSGPERWRIGDVFHALRVLLDFAKEYPEEFQGLSEAARVQTENDALPPKQSEGLALWRVIDGRGLLTNFGRQLLEGIRFGSGDAPDQRICGFANPVAPDDQGHFAAYWDLLRLRC